MEHRWPGMVTIQTVNRLLIGFDPGRDKCGLALVQASGAVGSADGVGVMGAGSIDRIWMHEVVSAGEAIAQIQALLQRHTVEKIIIGNQTTSKQWQQRLRAGLVQAKHPGIITPENIPPEIIPVDERNTSLLARDRYWQMFPPQGLQRLLPQGLRQPPRPIDDIVAILLVERYLLKTCSAP
jgi:RNase H-fold protein (predicted Holliday junction resolvase)